MIGAFLVNVWLSLNSSFCRTSCSSLSSLRPSKPPWQKKRAKEELLERVEALSAERRHADDKLASLQAELDRESVPQRGQEGELDSSGGS